MKTIVKQYSVKKKNNVVSKSKKQHYQLSLAPVQNT